MNARRPIGFPLLAGLLTMTLGAAAVAQISNAAPSVHPLAFVQTAAACVHTDPLNAPVL